MTVETRPESVRNPQSSNLADLETALAELTQAYGSADAGIGSIELFRHTKPKQFEPVCWRVRIGINDRVCEWTFSSETDARDLMLTATAMSDASGRHHMATGASARLVRNGAKWHYDHGAHDKGAYELHSVDLKWHRGNGTNCGNHDAGNNPDAGWLLDAVWHSKLDDARPDYSAADWFSIENLPVGTYDCGINIIRHLIASRETGVEFKNLAEFEFNWVAPVRRLVAEFRSGRHWALQTMPALGPREFASEPVKGHDRSVPHSMRIGVGISRVRHDAGPASWNGLIRLAQDLKGGIALRRENDEFSHASLAKVLDWADAYPEYSTLDKHGRALVRHDPVKMLDRQLSVLRDKMVAYVANEHLDDINALTDVFLSPMNWDDDDSDEKIMRRNCIISDLHNAMLTQCIRPEPAPES